MVWRGSCVGGRKGVVALVVTEECCAVEMPDYSRFPTDVDELEKGTGRRLYNRF